MRKTKKKKISIKKTLRLIIPLIIIIVIGINFNNIKIFYESKITGYPTNIIKIIHKYEIYNKIKKKDYSEVLAKEITSKYFNKSYVDNYLEINYYNNDNFLENINKLLKLGYTSNDINNIYDNLNDKSIALLIENEYFKDISQILDIKYFHEDNLNRYLQYKKELSIEELITYVNIGLDKPYYTDVFKIEEADNIEVLVNKYNSLPSDYVPSNLEAINPKYNKGNNNLMRKEARINFEEMCESAKNEGIIIYSGSAYRSYNYQLNLYNRYVNRDGKTKAETYTARAGYSEHQTGLATDILNSNIDYISAGDKEYDWLINNSYKYGFILRYPKDKEEITGYMYEEWHFRYVGKKIAAYLKENNLTYDEYIARK